MRCFIAIKKVGSGILGKIDLLYYPVSLVISLHDAW